MPKKPRTLNAHWADARCRMDAEKPVIEVEVSETLNAFKAARLCEWLHEAARWATAVQAEKKKGGGK